MRGHDAIIKALKKINLIILCCNRFFFCCYFVFYMFCSLERKKSDMTVVKREKGHGKLLVYGWDLFQF